MLSKISERLTTERDISRCHVTTRAQSKPLNPPKLLMQIEI